MLPTNRRPIHPGEILLQEFLLPRDMSQSAFARDLGVPLQRLNELVKGRRGISAETALLLSEALGTSPQFWLNLQNDVDLWDAMRRMSERKPAKASPRATPSRTRTKARV